VLDLCCQFLSRHALQSAVVIQEAKLSLG